MIFTFQPFTKLGVRVFPIYWMRKTTSKIDLCMSLLIAQFIKLWIDIIFHFSEKRSNIYACHRCNHISARTGLVRFNVFFAEELDYNVKYRSIYRGVWDDCNNISLNAWIVQISFSQLLYLYTWILHLFININVISLFKLDFDLISRLDKDRSLTLTSRQI